MVNLVKSGILGFDLLVGGGIPENHVVLIQSPTPTDNTVFTIQFIKKGLENFEPVLVVLSKISADKFRENLKEMGINYKQYERKGYMKIVDWYSFKSRGVQDVEEKDGIIYSSKDLTNLGIAINRGMKALRDAPTKRAVLDMLSAGINFFDFKRIYNFVQSMVAKCKSSNITTIFTMEIETEDMQRQSSLHGIFDGVVDLKVIREGDKVIRKIGILSMAGVHFDNKYRYYRLDSNEMVIYDKRGKRESRGMEKRSKPIPWTMGGEYEDLPQKVRDEIKMRILDVKSDPKDPAPWYSLGLILLTHEKHEDAIRAFDKVTDIKHDHIDAWRGKAEAQRALGREDEAKDSESKTQRVATEEDLKKKEKEIFKELEGELHDMLDELGEPPVEEGKEKVDEFECPLCGDMVQKNADKCPSCGVRFLEMEEVPDEVLERKEKEIEEIVFPSTAEGVLEELEEELGKFEQDEEVTDEVSFEEAVKEEKEDLDVKALPVEEREEEPKEPQYEEEGPTEKDIEEYTLDTESEALTYDEDFKEPVYFECPICGTMVDSEAVSCPGCGARFEGETEEIEEVELIEEPEAGLDEGYVEEFECPECDALIDADAKSCPFCGVKFEEEVQPELAELGLEALLKEEVAPTEPAFGMTNGLTNGLQSDRGGLTNGLQKERGGLTNGLTNGITNGLRALRAGITNGLTNGNGITNGIVPQKKALDQGGGTLRVLLTVGFFLLLIISPFLLTAVTAPEGIVIDGVFDDWRGVNKSTDDIEVQPFNENIDIIDFRVVGKQVEMSFYLEVAGTMLAGQPGGPLEERRVDTAYFFIDTDKDETTGYFIRGMGADYMVLIYGIDQEIMASSLFSYTEEKQAWDHWEQGVNVVSVARGSALEAQIPYEKLFIKNGDIVDVIFYMQSYDGDQDFSDTLLSNQRGVLTITQTGSAVDVISGSQNEILTLNLEAKYSQITLDELRLKRDGLSTDSDVAAVRLLDEQGKEVMGDTTNGYAVFKALKLSIEKDEQRVLKVLVDVSQNAVWENSLGYTIEGRNDVVINSGAVYLKSTSPQEGRFERSYIGSVPENITIDGAFGDWVGKHIRNDTVGDVSRPDIDIVRYGVSTMEDGTAFFLNVDGEICGGVEIPYFNDKKRIIREIPEGPGGGEGPELKPKTGEDVIYIFIDTKEDTGFSQGLPISADYMIEIKGRHNIVLSSHLLKWAGTRASDWTWNDLGPIKTELEFAKLEVGVTWQDIQFDSENERFNVYFWATDWDEKQSDYSNLEGVISGPTRGVIGDGGSRGYDVKYHAGYDAFFRNEDASIRFETEDGYHISWQMPKELVWEDAESRMPIANLKSSDLEIDQQKATWYNAYPGMNISIEYLFSYNQLKENIVLNNMIPDPFLYDGEKYLVFEMPIDYSEGLAILSSGAESELGLVTSDKIDFYDGGNVAFSISAPYAQDSQGNYIYCEYLYDEASRVLALRCPLSFLENAQYPVKIDPSLSFYFLQTDDHTDRQDRFGIDVVVGDFNGDGHADILSGAPGNDKEYFNGGRAYIFFGPFTADENTPDVILSFATGSYQQYGSYLGVGDFNNDGYDDAVLGGYFNLPVYIKYGSSSLSGTLTSPDVIVYPVTPFSTFGISIVSGNFNGDSYDDLVIGAPDQSTGENGKVYIFYYESADWSDGTINDAPDDVLQSADNTQFASFGYSLAVGKFYSGSLDDIAVGEPYYSFGSGLTGRVNIFEGDAINDNGNSPDIPNNHIDNPQGANGDYDRFGYSIAAGDFNPSSTTYDFDDLIVGEPQNDESASDAGRAYIFLCDDNAAGWQTNDTSPTDIPNPEGSNGVNDQFGYSVGTGDVYEDNIWDFFIGAPISDNGGQGNGTVYVYDCDGTSIPTDYRDSWNGTSGAERLGWSVAGGQFSSDINFLLAAGAPYWDDNNPSRPDAGRVYVMPIPEFTALNIPVITAGVLLLGMIYRKKRKRIE